VAGVLGRAPDDRQFTRKGDAERFLDAIRGDLAHGLYVDPAAGRTLFHDYAEEWRAAQVHRPGTAAQIESYLRLHAYPTLGRRKLANVRRSEIQAWVKELTHHLAPGSVELVYRWVSTIFKAAVGERLLAYSPCARVALPKRNDPEALLRLLDRSKRTTPAAGLGAQEASRRQGGPSRDCVILMIAYGQ